MIFFLSFITLFVRRKLNFPIGRHIEAIYINQWHICLLSDDDSRETNEIERTLTEKFFMQKLSM